MRVRVVLVLLALLPLLPAVGADAQQGQTVGVNLGYVAPGVWDVWRYDHPGGGAAFELSWAASLFPGADYDLHLYPEDSVDGGALPAGGQVFNLDQAIAHSSKRTFAPHVERIEAPLPAGTYYVVVVPFQAQGEVYTLTGLPGDLRHEGVAVGYIHRCDPPFC